MQNGLSLLCFLQPGELKSATQLIFIMLFAITTAKKCKLAYMCCDFGNLVSFMSLFWGRLAPGVCARKPRMVFK